MVFGFLFLVCGFYFHNHAQIETSLVSTKVYEYVSRERNSYNKSIRHKPEVRHIAFLKVHKAGGSTVQNILFRYGMKRGLMFVIPAKGCKFSSKRNEHEVILDPVQGPKQDILAVHSVFNQEIYSKYLWNDSKYLAIVREPLDLMISGAYYHRDRWHVAYLKNVPWENFITNLIRYPETYDPDLYSLTRNSMAMDFGLPDGLRVKEEELILKYLQRLDRTFDLVLILEHFQESLVLMRRMLNWPLSSILYIPLNDNKHPTVSKLNISEPDKLKFKERNFLDVALYEYFYNSFMTKLSREGEDFYEEVSYFERVLDKVQMYCLVTTKTTRELIIEESRWNERFVIFSDDCEDMRMSEIPFIDKLRDDRVKQLYQNML